MSAQKKEPELFQPPAAIPSNALTPMDMLDRAVSSGASIETLDKLMGLQERWEANQARKAFDKAIAEAKAELKPVMRNRTGHNSKKYADFAAIAAAVDPVLTKHEISYRFKSEQGDRISVTCILFGHGHSETTTLSGPPDKTGSKNDIQAIGSTLTYLQRYSLVQMLGLAAAEDTDGAFGNETLSTEELEVLQSKIVEVGADIPKFLTAFQIEAVSDLPKGRLQEALTRLDNYAKTQAKKKGA